MTIKEEIEKLAKVDIFSEARRPEWFAGKPFYLDYEKAFILVADAWKERIKGVSQGTLLLAFYENEANVSEALLLRALNPTKLPTDNDVASSMLEYYKDNLKTSGRDSQLDQFTKYQFSFSGLECRVLGTFYKEQSGKTVFGADVENFYSAHNYSVYKPIGKSLEAIVNYRPFNQVVGSESDLKIGRVRYSSSLRFQEGLEEVPLYISSRDFLGKRTALFGMTRTGKSNTVKKIIESSSNVSSKAKQSLMKTTEAQDASSNLDPFESNGCPKFPVGQIIFDMNGEYANANLQDEGTAIFELFKKNTVRYSVMDKSAEGFKVLKMNFYSEIQGGFDLIKKSLEIEKGGDYIKSFLAIDLAKPENYDLPIDQKTSDEKIAAIIYDRKKALYQCILYAAKFALPEKLKTVKFFGDADTINKITPEIKPHDRITIDQAIEWFSNLFDATATVEGEKLFNDYKKNKGHAFLDEDMKAMLIFLTRKSKPGGTATLSGFRKLRNLIDLHTPTSEESFEKEIISDLREGKIIIIDLSQGDPSTQKIYTDRICNAIFLDSMGNFVKNKPNNFIQFYFEEAHNLFPKQDDKDLNQVYNRIAKEGAKLHLGLIYATQEVSSISSNILKNTQNWFIAHLNNEDELKELKKYYDFTDFAAGLVRFSSDIDKGFVRVKTYSNPFVVPIQIDRFSIKK